MIDERTLITLAFGMVGFLFGNITNYFIKRREGKDTAANEDRRAIRELQSSLVQQAYADVARLQGELTRVTAERDRAMSLLWQAIPTAEHARTLLQEIDRGGTGGAS